jgi:hemoglobin
MSAGSPVAPPTGDLDSVTSVETMVRRFYGDVAQDALLGPLFNDVAAVDWSEHLPQLSLFWCRALLGVQGYSGNPFSKHAHVHRKSPFTRAHFNRWLDLFHDTIDQGWIGPNTERAKELACNVARVHSGQFLESPT